MVDELTKELVALASTLLLKAWHGLCLALGQAWLHSLLRKPVHRHICISTCQSLACLWLHADLLIEADLALTIGHQHGSSWGLLDHCCGSHGVDQPVVQVPERVEPLCTCHE